jgi:DNA adenine methylase
VKPYRQPVRYYGSKGRIADWLISHFPAHEHYVEPYGGGASVLLSKIPAPLETYNDLDNQVVNFFKVLREQTDELVRAIQLTPFARAEIALANEYAKGHIEPDPLEQARLFYVRCWQGRSSGSSVYKSTWRYMVKETRDRTVTEDWADTDHLLATAARLKRVQIENRPALKIIKRFDGPETLFYLDPPYIKDTRAKNWLKAYRHEMTDDDHIELADCLQEISGMAIISGYDSKLYQRLFVDRGGQPRTIQARDNANQYHTETIWLNPAVQRRALQPKLLAV